MTIIYYLFFRIWNLYPIVYCSNFPIKRSKTTTGRLTETSCLRKSDTCTESTKIKWRIYLSLKKDLLDSEAITCVSKCPVCIFTPFTVFLLQFYFIQLLLIRLRCIFLLFFSLYFFLILLAFYFFLFYFFPINHFLTIIYYYYYIVVLLLFYVGF